jgi:hypothetical protein
MSAVRRVLEPNPDHPAINRQLAALV